MVWGSLHRWPASNVEKYKCVFCVARTIWNHWLKLPQSKSSVYTPSVENGVQVLNIFNFKKFHIFRNFPKLLPTQKSWHKEIGLSFSNSKSYSQVIFREQRRTGQKYEWTIYKLYTMSKNLIFWPLIAIFRAVKTRLNTPGPRITLQACALGFISNWTFGPRAKTLNPKP